MVFICCPDAGKPSIHNHPRLIVEDIFVIGHPEPNADLMKDRMHESIVEECLILRKIVLSAVFLSKVTQFCVKKAIIRGIFPFV